MAAAGAGTPLRRASPSRRPPARRREATIVAVSEATRRELLAIDPLSIPRDRVFVAPPAIDSPPDPEVPPRRSTRDVLYVGGAGPNKNLDRLVRALVLVMPSLHEGFGLPIVEAMARGTAVACSRIDVSEEVAGDAAAYFDPRDPCSMARTLRSLLEDPVRRARLGAAGRHRSAKHSRTALVRRLTSIWAHALGAELLLKPATAAREPWP